MRSLLGVAFLLIFLTRLQAQTDTVFYAVRGNKAKNKMASKTYTVSTYAPVQPAGDTAQADTTHGTTRTYLTNGDKLLHESHFVISGVPVFDGPERNWDSTGNMTLETNYYRGSLHGSFKAYYPNGKTKRAEEYRYGNRLSGACYNEEGNEVPFFEYYVSPRPRGTVQLSSFLHNRISYSRKLRIEGAVGTLVVSFIVNRSGSISYVTIEKGLHPELDKQVRNAFNELPEGEPGYLDGKPYPIKVTVPMMFGVGSGDRAKAAMHKTGSFALNTFTVINPLNIFLAIGRAAFKQGNGSYRLNGAVNYYEEPIYGPRP